MDLVTALLDLVDALSTGVAVAVFWYAWVVPPDRSVLSPLERPSEPDELDRFVRAAALIKPSGRRLT